MWPPPLVPVSEATGPFPQSNWIIKPSINQSNTQSTEFPSGLGVLAGSFPWYDQSMDDSNDESTVTHDPLYNLINQSKVTMIVCLMIDNEKGIDIDKYRKRAQRIAANRSVNQTSNQQSNQLGNQHINESTDPSHPSCLLFKQFPMIDGQTTDDQSVVGLIDYLIGCLINRHMMYIHCWGGHGRTGVVVSCLIGRLYNQPISRSVNQSVNQSNIRHTKSATDCLIDCLIRHNQRQITNGISSPQAPSQFRQVVRIINQTIDQSNNIDPLVDQSISGSISQTNSALVERYMIPIDAQSIKQAISQANDSSNTDFTEVCRFKILTWNMLAQSLATTSSFPFVEPVHLSNNQRRKLWIDQLIQACNDQSIDRSINQSINLPDLVCLQEVDWIDYHELFLPFFLTHGFDGTHCSKISDSIKQSSNEPVNQSDDSSSNQPDQLDEQAIKQFLSHSKSVYRFEAHTQIINHPADQNSASQLASQPTAQQTKKDGCALFYRLSKFAMMGYQHIQLIDQSSDQSNNQPIDRSITQSATQSADQSGTSQVAIIAQFAPIVPRTNNQSNNQSNNQTIRASQRIFVTVCHLKARDLPGNAEIRARQIQSINRSINQSIAQLHNQTINQSSHSRNQSSYPLRCSSIIVGDFNDEPHSAAWNVLSNNRASIQSTNQTSVPSMMYKSVYDEVYGHLNDQSINSPYYTTYKRRLQLTKRVIDYIWYSHQSINPTNDESNTHIITSLQPSKHMSIPSINQFPNQLPSVNYPSDHLAIAAELVLFRKAINPSINQLNIQSNMNLVDQTVDQDDDEEQIRSKL